MFGEKRTAEYLSIQKGDFVLRASSPEETKFGTLPKKRVYIDKNNVEQTVHEYRTNMLIGKVGPIKIEQGEFGTQLKFGVETEQGFFMVATPIDSDYARTFMERIPGANLEKEVKLFAYDFEPEEGKRRKGISIAQQEGEEWVKLTNYFWDGKKNLYGFPEHEAVMDADAWKIHFLVVTKFLKNFITEKFGK